MAQCCITKVESEAKISSHTLYKLIGKYNYVWLYKEMRKRGRRGKERREDKRKKRKKRRDISAELGWYFFQNNLTSSSLVCLWSYIPDGDPYKKERR